MSDPFLSMDDLVMGWRNLKTKKNMKTVNPVHFHRYTLIIWLKVLIYVQYLAAFLKSFTVICPPFLSVK